MKRLFPVALFIMIVMAAFAAIFRYALWNQEQKRQRLAHVEEVVILTDLDSGMIELLSDPFYAESGYKIRVHHVPKHSLIEASLTDSGADVILTSQDVMRHLQEQAKLTSYASAQTDTTLEQFKDSNGYWTGIWVNPFVFVVNKDFAMLHPAFDYQWTEAFQRQIVQLSMTDFIAADMAEEFLMSFVEHYGTQRAFDLLHTAQPHIVQYGKYLSTPSRMAAMGKCDIGISGLMEARRSIREGFDAEIIYPRDGSPWYLIAAGLSSTGKHPDRGRRLIDWLLQPAKYRKALQNNNYDPICVNDAQIPPDRDGTTLSYWYLEKIYTEEGEKELLKQWVDQVRFGGTK
ncbi:MAG: ABC transporter substrate-binding protein [Dialister sp.]|nr:ABC transporter substrate-binding protein [Dialister sp.]